MSWWDKSQVVEMSVVEMSVALMSVGQKSRHHINKFICNELFVFMPCPFVVWSLSYVFSSFRKKTLLVLSTITIVLLSK